MIKFTIDQERAGMACFARMRVEKKTAIEYHSGMLILESLYNDKDWDRRYGNGVIPANVKEFETYGVHNGDNVKRSEGRSHDA